MLVGYKKLVFRYISPYISERTTKEIASKRRYFFSQSPDSVTSDKIEGFILL